MQGRAPTSFVGADGVMVGHTAAHSFLRDASLWLAPYMRDQAFGPVLVALLVVLIVILWRNLPPDDEQEEMAALQSPGSDPRASWETICAFAADQAGEALAERGPKRTAAVEARYKRYSEWCASRGHTGVELILATALWKAVGADGPRVALEPNIVPYHVAAGIEHWVLWYHPEATPGGTDLDPAAFVAHVRLFLDVDGADECCCFQNLPERRSVPTMAHAHVFLRTSSALAKLRAERRLRSPWAEAERLGGRGAEVGF